MSELSPWAALGVSAAVVALSAFFVAVEFALIAARRYRLEEAAHTSPSARAALRSAQELSLLLAGSQLGITLCTLALGAVAKPAVHHMLTPVMEGWGLPATSADVLAFVVSLVVVTFVHLVVGEMAPKSWAIAHPEKSATLLAIPMRLFMWVFRPVLVVLNGTANWCLQRVGVRAVDEVGAGHTPEALRQLVEHSARTGTLDPHRRDQLAAALELHSRPLREHARPSEDVVAVTPAADVARIQATARASGHLRLVVRAGDRARPLGVVHVRDTLTAPTGTTARDLMRPVLALQATTPVHSAVSVMRERRSHLAVVLDGDDVTGIVTLDDLLEPLLTVGEDRPAASGS
ncbi:hemolysin family protein [Saccharomonospora cyanea]|uniref:CBS domain-containing protein n=1 Tax=Saccharomonospora cyanea NA-134 TaxID=882082 RepID=H5XGN8_9PSEU|nr:hemolysin family protein [Saccharomonospora cyanea]EHR61581.1 CBS domain-containing protein [Saccharomonospora cyanea NA-134]